MITLIKNIFTGVDNKTFDLGRLLWAKMAIVYSAVTAYHVYKTGNFEYQNWAIGAGAILAAGGGSLALKAATEPKSSNSTVTVSKPTN